jgi:hypothetical protein
VKNFTGNIKDTGNIKVLMKTPLRKKIISGLL